VGQLSFETVAGSVPYLMQWSELVPLHPVFSMEYSKLLEFTRSEWNRLFSRAVNDELTQAEQDILCVSYLALLHKLDCIRQDVPALPPLHVVQNTIERLFHLAYWKFHLQSQRFKFPVLHISKYNENAGFTEIGHYLDTCFDIKKEYETKVNEISEKAKIRVAEEAIKKLAGEWVTPVSKKLLWRWVRAHLPDKYQADAEGWMGTIFLGSDNTVLDFDEDEIKLAEEIIVSSCPAGTGVMFAVRTRLDHIYKTWENHHKCFEIQLEDQDERMGVLVNGKQIEIDPPGAEPKITEFQSRGAFFKAQAKWTIANAAYLKYLQGIKNGNESEAGQL
jgi:hypothetical protein